MSETLIVSAKPEATIEPVPEGLHNAVCVGLYDVGTIYNERFDSVQRKLIITWDLPDLPSVEIERGEGKEKMPRCLYRRFTLSLAELAHLRRVLESWRGRRFSDDELSGFDLTKLLGKPCQLQVMHQAGKDGRIFANVENVLPTPKGAIVAAETEPAMFSVSKLEKAELPDWLPAWVGKLVKESREWEKLSHNGNPTHAASVAEELSATEEDGDDVPF